MGSFRQEHPLVRYQIYSGNADNIRDSIERGLLDLGVMTEPVDIRKYDFVPMPLNEIWGVLVRTDSELAEREAVRPEDLAGVPLITSAGDFVQSTFGKWFGPLYDRINIVATGNLLYNEAMLAESGHGCRPVHSAQLHLSKPPFHPPRPRAGNQHGAGVEKGPGVRARDGRVHRLRPAIPFQHF